MTTLLHWSHFTLIPSIGIGIFLLIYIYASMHYPGGSVSFPDKSGFDWVNNYWCDLIPAKAINGADNPARPFAVFSMIFLSGLVAIFFFQFADAFGFSNLWRRLIKITGSISMICGALIFTDWHNVMIGVASLFAIIPLIGIFKGLIQTSSVKFLLFGLICVVLLAMSNYFYYTEHFLDWLPLFQKITLLAVLMWIVLVNYHIYKKRNA